VVGLRPAVQPRSRNRYDLATDAFQHGVWATACGLRIR
jgi:hypothetical protein